MPKRYLYIPFKEDENNSQLEEQAWKWQSNTFYKNKSPTLIIHGDQQFAFGDDVEEGSSIYVIGHGHTTDWATDTICNTSNMNDKTIFYLDIEGVAERLKNDGLFPQMNAKIKLFFCDEMANNNAKDLANKFIKALGEEYYQSDTTVDYYNAILTLPMKMDDNELHKRAYGFFSAENQTAELKCKGRASEFRTRLSCKDFAPTLQDMPSTEINNKEGVEDTVEQKSQLCEML